MHGFISPGYVHDCCGRWDSLPALLSPLQLDPPIHSFLHVSFQCPDRTYVGVCLWSRVSCVAQADLKLEILLHQPQRTGIWGVHHHAHLEYFFPSFPGLLGVPSLLSQDIPHLLLLGPSHSSELYPGEISDIFHALLLSPVSSSIFTNWKQVEFPLLRHCIALSENHPESWGHLSFSVCSDTCLWCHCVFSRLYPCFVVKL